MGVPVGKVRLNMGLQQFEQRLEQLVEGVFARAFRAGLQPVELGRRLTREMDLVRTVGVRGLIAPNHFTVLLSPKDHDRFAPFEEALVDELRGAAREHARSERYHFVGPEEVELEEDPSQPAGVFRVAAEIRAGDGPLGTLVLPDGRRVETGTEPLTIGRLSECRIVLPDPNVSRRHAELTQQDGVVVVTDLGSTNGTLVNGKPIQSAALEDGDTITLGSTDLRFEAG